MSRVIPLILVFGLTIYALIDCARTDESQIKTLPKWGWLLLIIILGPQALAIGPIGIGNPTRIIRSNHPHLGSDLT